MIKLYQNSDTEVKYWETWENDGVHTIHWGSLGTHGDSEEIRDSFLKLESETIESHIQKKISEGFKTIDLKNHSILLIEYPVDGIDKNDLDKKYALHSRMDEILGWTGLGNCYGGSIGSESMVICCFVVNLPIAKKVITENLKNTEFADYSRIYGE